MLEESESYGLVRYGYKSGRCRRAKSTGPAYGIHIYSRAKEVIVWLGPKQKVFCLNFRSSATGNIGDESRSFKRLALPHNFRCIESTSRPHGAASSSKSVHMPSVGLLQ
jgi:hypothetical protein